MDPRKATKLIIGREVVTGNARTTNAVQRCPRGHVIRPHRDYRCPDCRESFGPCRCELFAHVTSSAGKVVNGKRHRPVYPILGGGFRVTYDRTRLGTLPEDPGIGRTVARDR